MGRPRRAKVKLPPHVHAVKAKGKEYFYYQPYRGSEREATRVKLPGAPFDLDGTPSAAWWDAYRVLSGEKETGPRSGSFRALLAVYQESPEWRELSARTQVLWRPLLGRVEQAWATLAVRGLEARHVLALRDAYADTPGMANNLIRALSSVLAWSVPRGGWDYNPCLGLQKLRRRRRLCALELGGDRILSSDRSAGYLACGRARALQRTAFERCSSNALERHQGRSHRCRSAKDREAAFNYGRAQI